MFTRELTKTVLEYAKQFPVVALLGPRQSGKTTLARAAFEKYRYISLENADMRALALQDPRGFLENYVDEVGIIIDEFQHVPVLLSYIQTIVDEQYRPGYFILTGSQNFLLNEAITQSLAGRVGILTLLPFSILELEHSAILPSTSDTFMVKGGYPRLYAQNFAPPQWYPSYIQSYIERDVRQIKNVTDLSLFQKFIQLCAGRIGQLVNFSSLGNDCGISAITARSWLSILEANYIIFFLQPYYKNFSKRLVKAPKLYFYDSGIACSLLGIETEEQLFKHYLRGGLFESMIISECAKSFYNTGRRPRLYFWRDNHGNEVDCLIEKGSELIAVEIKAGKTIASDYFNGLEYWKDLTGAQEGYVVYGGHETIKVKKGTVLSWFSLPTILK